MVRVAPVVPAALLASMVAYVVPVALGVPEITPVDVFIDAHEGRLVAL